MKNNMYRLKIWTKETGNSPMKWDVYAENDNDARLQMEDQKRIVSEVHKMTVTDCEILNQHETRDVRERECIIAKRKFA